MTDNPGSPGSHEYIVSYRIIVLRSNNPAGGIHE